MSSHGEGSEGRRHLSIDEVRSFIIDTISPKEIQLTDEFQATLIKAVALHVVNARTDGALLDGWEAVVATWREITGNEPPR